MSSGTTSAVGRRSRACWLGANLGLTHEGQVPSEATESHGLVGRPGGGVILVPPGADACGFGSEPVCGVQGGEYRGGGQAEAAMFRSGAHRFEGTDAVVLI